MSPLPQLPLHGALEREALLRTVREAYMEVFPTDSIIERLAVLPAGSYVALTCSPSKGIATTLDMTEQLIARGYRVVPHIAARLVHDEHHLDEILSRLEQLPIDSLFVPGGDSPRPAGKFASALELLRAMAARGHRFQEIGVAAHPEGHPSISDEVLLHELEQKQAHATYIVTQMCFDARALGAWLERIRTHGIGLPVWLGLPGESDRSALLGTSLRIGVGNSLRYLRNHGRIAAQMLMARTYRPDTLLHELAPWLADPAMRIAGHHLYCFNQVERTQAWRLAFLAALERPE